MFKRILVLQEGSTRAEQGLVIAERIARACGGTVIPLHAVPAPPKSSSHPRPATVRREGGNGAKAASLLHAALSQAPPGTETPVALDSRLEALALPATTGMQEGDLLLLVTSATAGSQRWLLESVGQRTVHAPPVPIFVLREGEPMLAHAGPQTTHRLHPVTAAVALGGSRQAEAAIVPAAHLVAALAAPAKGSLHLTRVVLRPHVAALLHDRVHIDPQQRDQAMREATDYLCQLTDDLRASLAGDLDLTVTWSIAVGSEVANALIGVAVHGFIDSGTCLFYGCDLLALAARGRNGRLPGGPGSITERLLVGTNLPLLLV